MHPTQALVTPSGDHTTEARRYDACQRCGDVPEGRSAYPLCLACAAPEPPLPGEEDTYQPSSSDVAGILRAAAHYLFRHGWIQGSYYDQTVSVFTPAACVVGAIATVCFGGPVEAPSQHFDAPGWAEYEAAISHLDVRLVLRHGTDVYSFNDAPGRTVDQVLAVLAEAADEWDHSHGGGA